jgi:Lon protease-like protein
MKLPSEIAVMSLPNAILFPQALLPLYIFEPRYRAMLKDALASHRMFSIALMRETPIPGQLEPDPCNIACVGIIRAAVNLSDGTSNVLLQGLSRVRLTDFVEGKPYRLATVEELTSQHADDVVSDALAAKTAELVELRNTQGKVVPPNVLKSLVNVGDAETLADLVAFIFLSDIRDKQTLLETLDVRLRLRKLDQVLQREIDQLKLQHKAQGKLPDKHIGLN